MGEFVVQSLSRVLTLRLHGLQHARPPRPSSSPGAYSNSMNQWYDPTILSRHPLLLLPSIFPSIRGFSNELVLHIGGQSIGASASVLPMNIQDWSPLGLTDLSLLSKGLSRVFAKTIVQKHQSFGAQVSLWSNLTSIHDYWKNHSFDYMDLCWQSNVSAF